MEYIVSYFPNVSGKKVKDISIREVFDIIRTGRIKPHIDAIRAEKDEKKREALKRNTPAITLSGTFGEKHSLDDFLKHTGLIQVDFDKVADIHKVNALLMKDNYTYSCFISPSGTGVKTIVKIIPEKESHEKSFLGLSRYYWDTYKLEMDKKCKDVSRLCFLSYDPELFVNEQSLLFTGAKEPANNQPSALPESVNRLTDLIDEVEKIVTRIEISRIDITTN
jgi:hypothetical protein